MKKFMILAAFAAMLTLAGCQEIEVGGNEEVETVKTQESLVFTATISAPTKTTVNVETGKVAWETTDEITVKDAAGATAIYKIQSIDETGKAIFVKKDGEQTLGAGPYSATYGTEPATSQEYSATAGKLYMTAPATSGSVFTFSVQCGLMLLNLEKRGESVSSITVTGTPAGTSGTVRYLLTCSSAESIDSAKDFYIALPAGNYTMIEITNPSGNVATLNSTSGVTVAVNHIKPVTIDKNKINFRVPAPLGGKFSVSATKQVYFSRGNLQAMYNGSTYIWGFAENQYDYIGEAPGNTTITSEELKTHQTEGAVVDLFGWSTAATYYGINTSIAYYSDYSGDFKDWGTAVDSEGTWRTLTNDEWQYLFGSSTERNGKYKHNVTLCGKRYCLVIAPDDFSGTIADSYDTSTWPVAEADGLVCLPAAKYRAGSQTFNPGDGYYWSSSVVNDNQAYGMCFSSTFSYLYSSKPSNRHYGSSVRLVSDVPAE